MVKKVYKTEEEWQELLTPEQFDVCRRKGTEKPYTGECAMPEEEAVYKCCCCGNELFSTLEKFESGTGWPSFWQPVSEDNLKYEEDYSMGVKRLEVKCAACDSHLGHVFEDGPPPTHMRYCINSVALKKEPPK